MILGVTGSRDWSSREVIAAAFDQAAADFGPGLAVVIEGGAHGADALCRIEATSRGWHVATVRAIWGLGKRAGNIRNDAMVYLGRNADAWLAFVNPCIKKDCLIPQPHDSHGAAGCIKAADNAGIAVRRYDHY